MSKLILAGLLIFIGCQDRKDKPVKPVEIKSNPKKVELSKDKILEKLKKIDSIKFLEDYIVNVINNGMNKLNYPSSPMDGGFALKEDAKDIARYVVTLSGKTSSDDQKAKAAAIYYTSNCGGCHGDDGKGLNGTFPDLTLKRLKGIELIKEELQRDVKNYM